MLTSKKLNNSIVILGHPVLHSDYLIHLFIFEQFTVENVVLARMFIISQHEFVAVLKEHCQGVNEHSCYFFIAVPALAKREVDVAFASITLQKHRY
jgi:hypothetical protein